MLELTAVDPFANGHWTSENISVLGFHLGMKMNDAFERARSAKLKLIGESGSGDEQQCKTGAECEVVDERGLPVGVMLRFGSDRKMSHLWVVKNAEEKLSLPERAAFAHLRFKGSMYELFDRYSDGLRLKLLGAEAAHEAAPVGRVTYRYPKIGLILQVNPCVHESPKHFCGDLTMELLLPTSP